jgi:hypothetical protein
MPERIIRQPARGTCVHCGAELVWAFDANEMPVALQPRDDGDRAVEVQPGQSPRAVYWSALLHSGARYAVHACLGARRGVIAARAPYHGKPPAVRGSDTSEAAADSVATGAALLRERVYRVIAERDGATCDEVEAQIDGRHQTVSARVRELVQLGRIVDTGQRRPTRSGRAARVYRVREAG